MADRTAFIQSKAPMSFAGVTSVNGFTISGVQPENTDRRVVFSFGEEGGYFKLSHNDGAAYISALSASELTVEAVLSEGNTVSELEAITSIPDFVGKNVYPAVALKVEAGASSFPTLKIAIRTSTETAQTTKVEESAIYELADENVTVISGNYTANITGSATVKVDVRFKTSGTWGDWRDLKDVSGLSAQAAQFRATYTVGSTDGSASASLGNIFLVYSSSGAKVAGSTTELILDTKHLDGKVADGLAFAQCFIRHKELLDADITAYVSFRRSVSKRVLLQLGMGTGQVQTIRLPDSGIDYNTIEVHANGEPFLDFDANTSTGEITLTVPAGHAVTASYEYGWEKEDWKPMKLRSRHRCDETGEFASKYEYELPSTETGKTITAVKLRLERPEGDVQDAVLGVATGEAQVFQLPHYARRDSIVCSGAWTYNDVTRVLKVQHTAGENIVISYRWSAESPEVTAVEFGFAEL